MSSFTFTNKPYRTELSVVDPGVYLDHSLGESLWGQLDLPDIPAEELIERLQESLREEGSLTAQQAIHAFYHPNERVAAAVLDAPPTLVFPTLKLSPEGFGSVKS